MSAMRLALLAPLALAAACASYNPLRWVGIVGEPPNPPTPLAPITDTVHATVAWTASVGKGEGYVFVPAVEGGHVFAAAANGGIAMIDEATGRVAERLDTGKKLSGGVAFGGGRVIAGTQGGEVIGFDPSTRQAWSTSVEGEVIAPAAVSGEVAVVRTSDGRILGLSVKDGKRLWVYQRPMPPLLLRSTTGVLALGRDVVAGYPNGKLIALDLEDGKLTWEVTVSQAHGATELERIADVAGLPVIDPPNVCAAAFQGKVACFEIATRSQVWSRDISSARSLATDAKNLYVVDVSGNVHALDKRTGASVWKQDKLAFRRLTAPAVVGAYVVVGDGYGYLHFLSPDNGAIVGRVATDGTGIQALVPAGAGFVAQTAGGTVVSIRP